MLVKRHLTTYECDRVIEALNNAGFALYNLASMLAKDSAHREYAVTNAQQVRLLLIDLNLLQPGEGD